MIGQAAPSVLHHLDQVDVDVLDHDPVGLAHLRRGHVGQCIQREFSQRDLVSGAGRAVPARRD